MRATGIKSLRGDSSLVSIGKSRNKVEVYVKYFHSHMGVGVKTTLGFGLRKRCLRLVCVKWFILWMPVMIGNILFFAVFCRPFVFYILCIAILNLEPFGVQIICMAMKF